MLPVPPILRYWLAPPSSPNRPGSASWSWRRSGSWTAHRDRRSVGARAAGRDGLRPLPWRAQPRPLVRAVLGPRSAALAVFVPEGPVVVGIDETIERRWGPKISARGIYRDPVRSSHGHFVKTSGLRWISVMLLVHIPGRIWGLPFLTTLAPSERFARQVGRRHKPLANARCCFWPAAGCQDAGSLLLPTPHTPSSNCSQHYVTGSPWSPACVWMPDCSIRHAGPAPEAGSPASAS
jgi:hypothetical protein